AARTLRTGMRFHDAVEAVVRTRTGGVVVSGDRHPDPIVEALRHQACEAELMQCIGRVRGVNRTAENPVQIDVLSDVALDLTVDELVGWEAAKLGFGGWIVSWGLHGVLLENPADRAKCFPELWKSERAGWREPNLGLSELFGAAGSRKVPPNPVYIILYRDLGELTSCSCPYVSYTTPSKEEPNHNGRSQRGRRALFNAALVPDPRAWLEDRLGKLEAFDAVAGPDRAL
ncbi:MAG: hypothetical protein ACJ8H8_03880, partial [Geminicoccaceae bacterium]